VDTDSEQAETGAWDRLSSGEMSDKGRIEATGETGRTWSRRIAVALPFKDSEVTEVEDPSMMIADPNSKIVKSISMAVGRKYDDLIIAAATGTALDGEGNANALPAAQILGSYTEAITFSAITKVQRQFLRNDIELDIPKVAVVGPEQIMQLMNTTEATSSDYVSGKLNELSSTGIVASWLGFTWIMSTRLTIPAADQLDCLFFTDQALGLHSPEDMRAFVMQDPSINYAWRPYAQINCGAIRVEDEHIVQLKVNDTET